MPMSLRPEEPAAGPWRVASVRDLVDLLFLAAGVPEGRPRVISVDGRSAAGKSTLAERLCAALPAAAIVHTDDIAWNQSFFDWAELFVQGVLQPLRDGREVRFRPPAWDHFDRAGAIEVPSGLDAVVIEGVGAGRHEVAHLVDAVVWVQSDFVEAERRGLARDNESGVNGDPAQTAAFWSEWMAQELAFLERQRPWERACVIVRGTDPPSGGLDHVVLAPPLGIEGAHVSG